MLNEWATYDELRAAAQEAREYGESSRRNQKVQRALRRGCLDVYHRVNTPKSKHPVLYHFVNDAAGTWFSFLVLQGTEGESYASAAITGHETPIFVIHSHAINRYMERSDFKGTIEQARMSIFAGLLLASPSKDSDTYYIPFSNGMFLCQEKDQVFRVRTFINERQMKPNQRLWKRKSQNDTVTNLEHLLEEMNETVNRLNNVRRRILSGR